MFHRVATYEEVGLLFLRVGTGLFLSILHGWGKVVGLYGNLVHGDEWRFPTVIGDIIGLPFPFFFAIISTITEFVGGLLFAIGFYTRYVTFLITINMFVAVYRHLITDMRYELAALFFLISLYILLRGAGRYSCDRIFNLDATARV